MKGLIEFKRKLQNDEEFKKKFCGIEDVKEAIELAKKFGFKINEEDVAQDSQLSVDLLGAVAGGKGEDSQIQVVHVSTVVTGKGSTAAHLGKIEM